MVYLNSLWALIGATVLAVAAVPAQADTAPASQAEIATAAQVETVTVTASRADSAVACDGLSGDDARRVAEQARRDGSHRKAAECFRVAGDLVQADRSTVRASADTGAVASRKAAANVEIAKSQARRLKAAFR
jgi:hypothetical protein